MQNVFKRELTGIGRANTALKSVKDVLLNAIVEQPRICSVVAKTNSGRIVKYWGRVGVTKYLKGNTNRSLETEQKYILFFDFKKGYRNINRKNIVALNGVNLSVDVRGI